MYQPATGNLKSYVAGRYFITEEDHRGEKK